MDTLSNKSCHDMHVVSSVCEKPSGISSFSLKIIAIVGMTLNHAAYIYYPYLPFVVRCIFFAVGGLTFPIMAFLLVEGYRHTSSVKRYARRLFAFALLAQIPFMFFLAHELNVLFTLLIGLIILYLYDHVKNRPLFWLLACVLTAASSISDWAILGPIMILMMRVLPDRRQRIVLPLLIPIVGNGGQYVISLVTTFDLNLLPFVLYPLVGCSLTIPLLLSYRGSRGKPLKWFFYAYYPCHIAFLGLAKGFIFGDWTLGF